MKLFLKLFTIFSILIVIAIYGWFNFDVSEQSREITPFNSIHVSDPINVYLKQADKESVTVRSDSNLLEQLIVEVINGKLNIYNKGKIQHERVLDVFVNYIVLDTIKTSAQSTLTGLGEMSTPKLLIEASGSSEIKLQLHSSSLKLIMNDAANVQLAGTTNDFDLSINHVGDLMAYNFISQNCMVKIDTGKQSPGIARVNVQSSLDVIINGPRCLKYKGAPNITNQMITGKGKLIKQ